ncbi:MAG: HlyD family efflux transporter periplasmic adaptor subunit [Rhodanobacteraceae bacterium]|nr:MAG: HlyD family efflux transporter periplasmic adaptor subunit [Rhodanobacteraceae bacterium]
MTSPIIQNPITEEEKAAGVKARRLAKRRWVLRGLVGVIVLVAIAWTLYYLLVARWYEGTDDAYVSGNVVQITPQIPGTVISIGADDNDFVRVGQPLVKLDPADADVALAKAEAALAQAVRRVRGLQSTVHSASADVAVREAAVRQARADYQRRQGLAASGAISNEELAHARDALTTAESALAAAQAQRTTADAQISGTQITNNPDVNAAAARVRAAWLNDQRTTLLAPVSGYVAKRTVQVGQRVQPGMPLMAVVPLKQAWVDANFKETQLTDMRIGQPVTLTSGVYGGSVKYHGRVEGLGIGTGSAFALLPAQNASGNWIKIVQRLPVRISLDPRELEKQPLRIGMSMDVEVNLHNRKGPMLSTQPPRHPVFSTNVFARNEAGADALIARIIKANAGAADQAPVAHAGGALAGMH